MRDNLLDVENLSMRFGGLLAIDDLSFQQKKIILPLLLVRMALEKLQFLTV